MLTNKELMHQLEKYPKDYPVKLGRSKNAQFARSVHGNLKDKTVRIESNKIS